MSAITARWFRIFHGHLPMSSESSDGNYQMFLYIAVNVIQHPHVSIQQKTLSLLTKLELGNAIKANKETTIFTLSPRI